MYICLVPSSEIKISYDRTRNPVRVDYRIKSRLAGDSTKATNSSRKNIQVVTRLIAESKSRSSTRGSSFNYSLPKSFGIWRRTLLCPTEFVERVLIPVLLLRAVNGSCYDYEARS